MKQNFSALNINESQVKRCGSIHKSKFIYLSDQYLLFLHVSTFKLRIIIIILLTDKPT